MLGSATEWIRGWGAPARFAARLNRSMVRFETRRAPGCGQKITVLPPAIIEIALLMMVSLGLVTGVMTAIGP